MGRRARRARTRRTRSPHNRVVQRCARRRYRSRAVVAGGLRACAVRAEEMEDRRTKAWAGPMVLGASPQRELRLLTLELAADLVKTVRKDRTEIRALLV